MCNSDIEDTPHFLIKCLSLEQTRQPFIDKIKALLNTVDKELFHIELVMTGALRIPMSIRPYSNI
jgi:hypothetical protein